VKHKWNTESDSVAYFGLTRILVPILGKELTIPDIQLTDYRSNPVTLL